MTPTEVEGREGRDVEAVVATLFAAIEAGDLDGVAGCFADDIRVWHSMTDRTVDKAGCLAILGWLAGAPEVTMRYDLEEQIVVGARVARRHRLLVTVDGHDPIDMPTAIFFTVEGGLVTSIEEYVDEKGTERLIALVPFRA